MRYPCVHDVSPLQRLAAATALVILVLCWPAAAAARSVRYGGHTISVPRGWAVYDLRQHPSTCVRFNRHALYLGSPAARQQCPAYSVGRTEAILVQPSGKVTATWNSHPAVIRRALGTLPTVPARSQRPGAELRLARASAAGAVYTGLGFDVCSAPSVSEMSAWRNTKYHAVGIYLGGANSACSQPNLTSSWVSKESAAGWHLIPTYVGLQAPGPGASCSSCATIKSTRAGSEGTAAANDAVASAQSIGLGSGNPIYYDMEAYAPSRTTTATVLKFLSAWTARLHTLGYVSGVYSSGASGIQDLAATYGSRYTEPDDLWVADWNNRQTTNDPYIPAGDWPAHQRVHQYSGGRTETHGGVSLDIDGDYLDGSTAGAAAVIRTRAPSVSIKPAVDGSIQLNATWPGATRIASWQVLAGSSADALSALGTPTTGGAATTFKVHSQFGYYTVQALDPNGRLLGTAPPAAVRPHLAIYGRSAFVPTHGLAGVPAGCFTGSDCQLSTTVTAGKTLIASGRPQRIAAAGGGVLHFKLSSTGRSMLTAARGHLPVRVRISDTSGVKASTSIKLILFSAHGKNPERSVQPAPTLRVVGVTDFVYRSAVGGILAACPGSVPCSVRTTIEVGNTTIASAGPQFLGANELGYLPFKLTPAGRRMLSRAHGNKLGVSVTLTDVTSSTTAGAHLVLVSYR